MSNTEKAKQAKKEMLTKIENLLGCSLDKIVRADIYYSEIFDIFFYLKYASKDPEKIYKEKKKLKDRVHRVRFFSYFPAYDSLLDPVKPAKIFMVFMLDIEISVFIPFDILIKEAHKMELEPKSDGTYKIHINASDMSNIFIEEIPDVDIKQYCNRFMLKQKEFSISNSDFSSSDNHTIEQDISLPVKSIYIEGNIKEVLCNQYERNPQARRKCVEIHGLNCHICGFNFQKFYGDYGSKFIHVHHLVPISKIGENYEVDPEKDLIPLCANCHAIVHRVDPPYTPQEVKESINRSFSNLRK